MNQLSGVTPPGGSSPSPSPLSYDAAGNVVSDNGSGNTYLYDGEGRVCAVASSGPTGGVLLTGYIYDADGTRVAKGTIQRWGTCDPATNGFQPMTDYILSPGPGGSSEAQLTEMAMDENGQMARKHTNVWAGDKLLATYDRDGCTITSPTGSARAAYRPTPAAPSRMPARACPTATPSIASVPPSPPNTTSPAKKGTPNQAMTTSGLSTMPAQWGDG